MAEATLQLPAPYVCEMCKKFIEDEVGSLEGVEMARAETSTRQVVVRFDEQIIPIEQIAEVANKFGCHVHCWFWTDERYKRLNIDFHV